MSPVLQRGTPNCCQVRIALTLHSQSTERSIVQQGMQANAVSFRIYTRSREQARTEHRPRPPSKGLAEGCGDDRQAGPVTGCQMYYLFLVWPGSVVMLLMMLWPLIWQETCETGPRRRTRRHHQYEWEERSQGSQRSMHSESGMNMNLCHVIKVWLKNSISVSMVFFLLILKIKAISNRFPFNIKGLLRSNF